MPLAVTIVPLGLFIVPSTNPSSWAVTSAATLWVGVVGFLESRGPRAWTLGAFIVVATLVGAGARSDTAAYSALSIVVATALVAERTRSFALRAALPAALAMVSVAFYFSGSQHGAIATGLLDHAGEAPVGVGENITGTISRLIHFPSLIAGAFGGWPLGWFDTPLPDAVWILAIIPAATAVLLGLWHSRRREWAAVVTVAAVMVAGPLIVLAKTRAPVGQYVQPRYILPLLIVIVGIALFRRTATRSVIPRPIAWFAAGTLWLAQSIALHATLRRYVTGIDGSGWNLDTGREWWWWDSGPGPMAVWVLTCVAAAAALASLAHHLSRSPVGGAY